jgi:hypothetical protein
MKESNEKIKKLKTGWLLLWAICLFVFAAGCSDQDDPDDSKEPVPEIPEVPEHVRYELLKEYSFEELKKMENNFFEANDITSGLLSLIKESKYTGSVQLRVYKVMLESDHTDGSNTKMNLSGLLIVQIGRAHV